MTLYDLLLFLHILGAAIWLGGEVTTFALRALALRSGDRGLTLAVVRHTDRINIMVISPGVAIVLGAGIALVLEGDWGFDRFFVVFGLAGFALSSVFGGLFTFRQGRALQQAVARGEGESEQAGRLIRRVQQGLLADVALLVAILFVMAAKPGS